MANDDQYDLLLGLFAVQMQMVSVDEFAAAAADWGAAAGESVPFVRALVGRGVLTEERLALLRPLVEQHVRDHGGVERSLEAVAAGSDTAARSLAAAQGPRFEKTRDLLRTFVLKPTPRSAGEASKAGSTLEPSTPGGPGRPRFDILRPHARGGLGEVYVAHDRELNREVALKEIQGRMANDEASRNRFFLEAEVTGGLEHPGIVPVYGLGTYEDGRPFYAMRFIKGDTLQKAVSRFHERRGGGPAPADFAGVEFHELVGRVVDVCHAVEYAHSRGVLHRDLKPGNVMLGKHGETLVVDWGLVKTIGRDDEERGTSEEATLHPISGNDSYQTLMGQAVGTPMYMSPEAARGEVDSLNKASDVYSLGATLYAVLTNRPPYESGEGVVERAKAGEFPPPRELVEAVPKPLEAVCLKAMSYRPGDRYASAEALAEDLQRWMADEPVAAFADPLPTRLRRTVKRHPAASAALAAGVLLSVVGLSVFSGVLAGKNRELAAAYGQSKANAAAAVEQAVRSAIDADVLMSEAGVRHEDREAKMEASISLLDGLHGPRPEELNFARAVVSNRLGNVKRYLRKDREAVALLEDSLRRQEAVPAADRSPRQWHQLIQTHRDVAIAYRHVGQLDRAETHLDYADSVLAWWRPSQPDDVGLKRLQALTDTTRASVLEDRLDAAAYEAVARRASRAFRELAAAEDHVLDDYTFDLINSGLLSTALFELGRPAEADEVFEAARRRGLEYLRRSPTRDVRSTYGLLLVSRCEDLCADSPIDGAAAALVAEAEEVLSGPFDEYGEPFGVPLHRAVLYRARIRAASEAFAEAAASAGRAADYFRGRADSSNDPQAWHHLAESLQTVADVAVVQGDEEAAAEARREAAAAARTAAELRPGNAKYRRLQRQLQEQPPA